MQDQIEFRNRVAELRKRKSNVPPALGVLSTFLFVGVGLWVLKNNFTWWLGGVVFVLIGFMQYRLVLASHEAVHKNLFHPLWLNEAAGLVCPRSLRSVMTRWCLCLGGVPSRAICPALRSAQRSFTQPPRAFTCRPD